MNKLHMLSLLTMGALLASGAVMAADTPAPKPATDGERHVQRIVVQTDGESADFEDLDGLGWLEDDDELLAGGPEGEQRQVIVRRIGGQGGAGGPGGPGGGRGMMMMHGGGAGGGQCGEECMGGGAGGHGAGGHMGMGQGMGGRGMGRGGMRHPGMMFAMLDLNDAQKAKMRDIHERAQRTQIQARADMQIAQMDMRKLMRADRPDQAAINAQIDRMAQMRASMQKTRVATHLEARALLTPDQLKKMQEMREKGPMGMHGGMGGPGMGQGMHPGMGGMGAGPHGPMATPKPKVK